MQIPGEPTITIETSDHNPPYHFYELSRIHTLFQSGGKDAVLLLAESLLEIAAYVEQNRQRLEQEKEQDDKRQWKAVDSEMADMAQIDHEWRAYRNEE